MDIDLVVPWVDGSDIDHQKLKEKYIKTYTGVDSQAIIKARFQDNGELKYLLRSVEQYANFVRNIFIITSNNQVPKWLNLNNHRIKLISDSQIMPQDALPTFNSMAIEACIANIPNLSDHFLYANDDMFFGNLVDKSFFFNKKGYPIIRFKNNFHPQKKITGLYAIATRNTLDMFYNKFGIKLPFFEHHNIDAYYKPDIIDCSKEFEKEFKQTIYHKFKTNQDIHRIIYSCYSYQIKHADIKCYTLSKMPNSLRAFTKVLYKLCKDSKMIGLEEKKYKIFHKSKIKLFCMNDNEATTDEDRIRGMNFLETYFPIKSSFEK